MAAVEFPNANIVNLLLSRGAKVNAKNNNNKTALYLAVARGHAELQEEHFEIPYVKKEWNFLFTQR